MNLSGIMFRLEQIETELDGVKGDLERELRFGNFSVFPDECIIKQALKLVNTAALATEEAGTWIKDLQEPKKEVK